MRVYVVWARIMPHCSGEREDITRVPSKRCIDVHVHNCYGRLAIDRLYSYGMERGSIALALTEHYSDIYMKRAFRLVMRTLGARSEHVVILGDIFDGGRLLHGESEQHDRERHLRRLCAILGCSQPNMLKQTKGAGGRSLLYTSGNHDVGIGEWWSQSAQDTFQQHFGPTFRFAVNGVEFLAIDSPAMSHNSQYRATIAKEEFLKVLRSAPQNVSQATTPRILLSHIPLWRPPDEGCGTLREKPRLRQGYGVSYQNMLQKDISDWLLKVGNVHLVLSGDDHDVCVVAHSNAVEATIPTFSWLQGVAQPGFAAVSRALWMAEV